MAWPDANPSEKLAADVRIEDYGSIFLFLLLTRTAAQWVEDNVSRERMYFAGALVVERRYVSDLALGLRLDGLTVV